MNETDNLKKSPKLHEIEINYSHFSSTQNNEDNEKVNTNTQ